MCLPPAINQCASHHPRSPFLREVNKDQGQSYSVLGQNHSVIVSTALPMLYNRSVWGAKDLTANSELENK